MMSLYAYKTYLSSILYIFLIFQILLFQQKTGNNSTIHSVSEAVEAEKLGVSYLTAGHIYVTDCKKGLPPRGLPFLQNVCQAVQIPVYGIGGIKIDEAQLHELKNAGAAGGCVMSGMMHV